ncbi:MAG: cation:proton antiporter [Spirochaeta sp.]
MTTIIGIILMVSGCILIAFGILGTWILPDLLLRMHASTKCGVTGAATIIMGTMLLSEQWGFILKLGIIMIFIFITAPLIAHILAAGFFAEQEDTR